MNFTASIFWLISCKSQCIFTFRKTLLQDLNLGGWQRLQERRLHDWHRVTVIISHLIQSCAWENCGNYSEMKLVQNGEEGRRENLKFRSGCPRPLRILSCSFHVVVWAKIYKYVKRTCSKRGHCFCTWNVLFFASNRRLRFVVPLGFDLYRLSKIGQLQIYIL